MQYSNETMVVTKPRKTLRNKVQTRNVAKLRIGPLSESTMLRARLGGRAHSLGPPLGPKLSQKAPQQRQAVECPRAVPGVFRALLDARRVSNAALANAALALSLKIWKNVSSWGAASKNKSKKPWVCIFTLLLCGNRCRFSESVILFSRCTHLRKQT